MSAIEALTWITRQPWSRQLTVRQLAILAELRGEHTAAAVARAVGGNRMTALVTLRRLVRLGLVEPASDAPADHRYRRTALGHHVIGTLS